MHLSHVSFVHTYSISILLANRLTSPAGSVMIMPVLRLTRVLVRRFVRPVRSLLSRPTLLYDSLCHTPTLSCTLPQITKYSRFFFRVFAVS